MSTQKIKPANHEEDQDSRTTEETGIKLHSRSQNTGTQNTDARQDDKQGASKTEDDRERIKNRNEDTANDPSRVDRTGDPERKNDATRINQQTEDEGPDHVGDPARGQRSGNKSI